ncbi:hypothetical protein DFH11DRAFT_632960 [Phellopilus nigrolimitatus]|nr:hypothetical protein DFH11DRAFT_632960 [Phellopilus nigrolimitatus]
MGDFDIILDRIESKMPEASHTLRGACKLTGESPTLAIKNLSVFQVKDIGQWDAPFLIPFIGATMHKLFRTTVVRPLDGSVATSGFVNCENKETPVDTFLDFDLEIVSPSKQSSNHRTGTAPFMARKVLDLSNKEFTRGFHHDLESVLYTVVWQGVGYKGYKIPKKGDILADWRKGSWKKILGAKREFIRENSTMMEVLEYIEDEKLRFQCRGIGTCFQDAHANVGVQEALKNEKWRKLTIEERLLAAKTTPQVAAMTTPPVTYTQWMEGAGEDLSCTCCQQTGDTHSLLKSAATQRLS